MVPVADLEPGTNGRIRIPVGRDPVSISARLSAGGSVRVRLSAA
jgi:hypothetical protein